MEEEQREISQRLPTESPSAVPVIITSASAQSLPIATSSVDRVLTSPPYLTRIDYAVAYARELAVLGIDIQNDRKLRESLMGTTSIRPIDSRTAIDTFGDTASDLVKKISEHGSHASRGYYLKQACQYLSDLTVSMDEITRVCKIGAIATFVVQDSYYKEIPIPLADICQEEAEIRGWVKVRRKPFPVVRTLASLNSGARAYPKGRVSETVLVLKRAR
jgi:hypothetical protein